jgi:dinuclear metal center YbgI/SA1388 family protein
MDLHALCSALDEYLAVGEFDDAAVNGLQLEACAEVDRLAISVDASLDAIDGAEDIGADLLLCHHGLLWGGPAPLTGLLGQRAGQLFRGGISLYAAHVPLDAHPRVGNNAVLAELVGLGDPVPFGLYRGRRLGFAGDLAQAATAAEVVASLEGSVGPCLGTVGADGRTVSRVAVVSGAAGDLAAEAVAAGVELVITGEPDHVAATSARDLGVGLVFVGHHATEVFGVRAVAQWLRGEFGLPFVEVGVGSGF